MHFLKPAPALAVRATVASVSDKCICAHESFSTLQGKLLSPEPHFNLSMQALQPLFQIASRVAVSIGSSPSTDAASVDFSHIEASVCTDTAYQGLSCLRVQGDLPTLPDWTFLWLLFAA